MEHLSNSLQIMFYSLNHHYHCPTVNHLSNQVLGKMVGTNEPKTSTDIQVVSCRNEIKEKVAKRNYRLQLCTMRNSSHVSNYSTLYHLIFKILNKKENKSELSRSWNE